MSNNKLGPQHSFHLVDPSPWPFFTVNGALAITCGAVMCFHGFSHGVFTLTIGFLAVIGCCVFWWRDVIREATFLGKHTIAVQMGLRLGMLLFILSEVMFFFSFFWTFFYLSISPGIEGGNCWPPVGIIGFKAGGVPLLNTIILLISGATITWAHYSLVLGNYIETYDGFLFTIALALIFTIIQLCEYLEASFDISDGAYGSIFYMATGFHGFHVIIGTVFILVGFFRFLNYHFSTKRHFGFEAASWYWHFVDVVRVFLYFSVYYWGNLQVVFTNNF